MIRTIYQCRECGGQIAHNTRVCPHCGHRSTSLFTWIVAIFIIAPLTFCILAAIFESNTPKALETARPAAATVTLMSDEKIGRDSRQLVANDLQRKLRGRGLDVTFTLQGPKGEVLVMSGADVTLSLVGQVFPLRDKKTRREMASLGFTEVDLPWGGKIDLP